jgi:hypothetical protein
VYSPTGNTGRLYRPDSSLWVSRRVPVAACVATTLAPTTAAPFWSMTVPSNRPVAPVCAWAACTPPHKQIVNAHKQTAIFAAILSFRVRFTGSSITSCVSKHLPILNSLVSTYR